MRQWGSGPPARFRALRDLCGSGTGGMNARSPPFEVAQTAEALDDLFLH
jgi:hypothetical protein